MKKRLIGTLAAAAVLAPALTLAGSGQAFAAGNPVTWNNKSTGEYLAYNNSRVRLVSASGYSTHWTEYKQSDGTYLMKFAGNGKCLDSNSNGDVYLLDCNGGNYQEWYEIHDSADADWILKDKATGLVLDTGGTGGVYTDTEDDFQLAQRWS
ncbi:MULTISPECIES: RICIN domain-containing protein [unclassified Streptomyces]|uniref:RICIN domain-containing protein n=1 Tax=unclassified Streptomyces TaxID=2593676 RepID=UPI00341510BB